MRAWKTNGGYNITIPDTDKYTTTSTCSKFPYYYYESSRIHYFLRSLDDHQLSKEEGTVSKAPCIRGSSSIDTIDQ